jgi:hypothetical protein
MHTCMQCIPSNSSGRGIRWLGTGGWTHDHPYYGFEDLYQASSRCNKEGYPLYNTMIINAEPLSYPHLGRRGEPGRARSTPRS